MKNVDAVPSSKFKLEFGSMEWPVMKEIASNIDSVIIIKKEDYVTCVRILTIVKLTSMSRDLIDYLK